MHQEAVQQHANNAESPNDHKYTYASAAAKSNGRYRTPPPDHPTLFQERIKAHQALLLQMCNCRFCLKSYTRKYLFLISNTHPHPDIHHRDMASNTLIFHHQKYMGYQHDKQALVRLPRQHLKISGISARQTSSYPNLIITFPMKSKSATYSQYYHLQLKHPPISRRRQLRPHPILHCLQKPTTARLLILSSVSFYKTANASITTKTLYPASRKMAFAVFIPTAHSLNSFTRNHSEANLMERLCILRNSNM